MSPLVLSLTFLQTQPDARLVELARQGHEPAFEALARRYRRPLLSYCRRLEAHAGGAEDALQQTLLQAWRALRTGAEVRDVRAWLYRIAHNVSVNANRVRIPTPHEMPETPGGQGADQVAEQRLQARAALAIVATLPALQRQVFLSTTVDGASHDEIAAALGLSSGAVRGLIYRARAAVRAAAAAVTPSPVIHWAIRAAASPSGGTPAVLDAVAGGGGIGFVAVLAKGGAVLTLAGAVAAAGGVTFPHSAHPHHRSVAHPVHAARRLDPTSQVRAGILVTSVLATRAAGQGAEAERFSAARGSSARHDHGGSRNGSGGHTDRGGDGSEGDGSSQRSGGPSPGGSSPQATIASSGGGSSTDGGPGGGGASSGGGSSSDGGPSSHGGSSSDGGSRGGSD